MRSKVLQEILDETPKDVKLVVRRYADSLKRVHQNMEEKEMSQKELAEQFNLKEQDK
jgi:hypothetical protein